MRRRTRSKAGFWFGTAAWHAIAPSSASELWRGRVKVFEMAVAIEQHPVDVNRMQLGAAGHVVADRVYFGGRGIFSEMAKPTRGSLPAMIPVSTSACSSAWHRQHWRPWRRFAAVPKRWPLVMLATSMPWRAASVGARRPRFVPCGTGRPRRDLSRSLPPAHRAPVPAPRWRCAARAQAQAPAIGGTPEDDRARSQRSWQDQASKLLQARQVLSHCGASLAASGAGAIIRGSCLRSQAIVFTR